MYDASNGSFWFTEMNKLIIEPTYETLFNCNRRAIVEALEEHRYLLCTLLNTLSRAVIIKVSVEWKPVRASPTQPPALAA